MCVAADGSTGVARPSRPEGQAGTCPPASGTDSSPPLPTRTTFPSFTDSIDVQKQTFSAVGLATKDLVTVVGAHTIGTTQCQFFRYRLYNFTSDGKPDPTIDGRFLGQLRALCPADGDAAKRVALDNGGGGSFDEHFFENLEGGKGVLESDQKLFSDASTRRYVEGYTGLLAGLVGEFDSEFAASMVKMSKVCSAFNS